MQVQDAPTAANAELPSAPLPLRDDTFLGVCEALGQDFGFNANWLRVALAASVLWSWELAIAGYLALGVIVLVSRLLVREPRRVAEVQPTAEAQAVQRAPAAEKAEEEELLAA